MYLRNIFNTILSKFGILLLNFTIIVCSTQFWGAEGRGIISILFADLAMIIIINNIFSGSSISYFTPRMNIKEAILSSYLLILGISLISALIFSLALKHQHFFPLLFLSIITSFATLNLAIFVGKEKIFLHNLYSLLIPLFILLLLAIFKFTVPSFSITSYFWSYSLAYSLVWMLSFHKLKLVPIFFQKMNFTVQKNIFAYGWKNELSNFFQFLNYRFTYFVILYYLGISHVGVFSIGIAVAESIWIISKSISLVQYSKLLNPSNQKDSIKSTNRLALVSVSITIAIGVFIILIPAAWFTIVFGKDFSQVKNITLLIYPGIIFMAFSNIYGHFMAATSNMSPLIFKSVLGLIAIILFSFILIPKYGLTGACIATNFAHLISSTYIYIAFLHKTKLNDRYR